jgi:hypothetical protein
MRHFLPHSAATVVPHPTQGKGKGVFLIDERISWAARHTKGTLVPPRQGPSCGGECRGAATCARGGSRACLFVGASWRPKERLGQFRDGMNIGWFGDAATQMRWVTWAWKDGSVGIPEARLVNGGAERRKQPSAIQAHRIVISKSSSDPLWLREHPGNRVGRAAEMI